MLPQSCLHNLSKDKISLMNISLSDDELLEEHFLMQIYRVCLGAGLRPLSGRTRSLEVDASHFHRICWVVCHHLGVIQKAFGSGFRVLSLAA